MAFFVHPIVWTLYILFQLAKSEVLWSYPVTDTSAIPSDWRKTGTGSVTSVDDTLNCPQNTQFCWQGYAANKHQDWELTRGVESTISHQNIVFSYQLSTILTSNSHRCDIEYITDGTQNWKDIISVQGSTNINDTFSNWIPLPDGNLNGIQIRFTGTANNVQGDRTCWFNGLQLTGDPITHPPTTATPTTAIPTTPTTATPTTNAPTTAIPTTIAPTTVTPTTATPTTSTPTGSPTQPTTTAPTTNMPTTNAPTTSSPSKSPVTHAPTPTPTDKSLPPSTAPSISPTLPVPTSTPTIPPTKSPSITPTTGGSGGVPETTTATNSNGNKGDNDSASIGSFAGSVNGIITFIGIAILLLLCIIIAIIFVIKRNNKSTDNTNRIRASIDDHQQITASSPKSYTNNTNDAIQMGTTNASEREQQSDDEIVLISTGNVTAGGPEYNEPEIEDDYKEDIELQMGDGSEHNSDDDVLNTGHVTMGGPEPEIQDDYKEDVELAFGDGSDNDSDNDVINTGHVTMGGPPVPAVPAGDDSDEQVLLSSGHITMGGPQMDLNESDDDENVPPPPQPPVEYIQEEQSDDDDILAGISTLQ